MNIRTVQLMPGGGFDKVIVTTTETRDPGPEEISVRIHASSPNFHAYGIVSGAMAMAPHEVRVPMSDGAGEVIAVGAGVDEFAIDDYVVSTFFPDWIDGEPEAEGFFPTPGDGIDGYAPKQVAMPATAFTRARHGYNHAEAATLTTVGLTAWCALMADGSLKPGEIVLVQGTGGTSIFALQFAKQVGAQVVIAKNFGLTRRLATLPAQADG